MNLSYRIFKVWRRDLIVWQKYLISSMVANFGEPLLYLFAMGFGLGKLIPQIGGLTYPEFIAPAILITSVMNGASFETTFSSYTRMEVQKTFHGIAMTPVSMEEVIAGEILWAATKATMTSSAIFVVLMLFGLIHSPWVLLMPFLMFAVGLLFASFGMLVTSFARSYDFFSYYFTLFVSPMFVFSGTFFPLKQLPTWAQVIAHLLPLTYAVRISRNLFSGHPSWLDFVAFLGMILVALFVGMLAMKRLVKRILV